MQFIVVQRICPSSTESGEECRTNFAILLNQFDDCYLQAVDHDNTRKSLTVAVTAACASFRSAFVDSAGKSDKAPPVDACACRIRVIGPDMEPDTICACDSELDSSSTDLYIDARRYVGTVTIVK